MSKTNFKLKEKIRYSIDNFMSKGGLSVFMALMVLFVLAMIVIAGLRWIAVFFQPDEENLKSVLDQWWLAFMQVADSGTVAEDTGRGFPHRIVGVIGLFLGLVLFSSLVAFITNQFDQMITNLRKGTSRVIEKDHTLILGFGDRVLEIIRELIVANESEKSPAIVVLSELEKDEMDDYFRDRIEELKTTRIITRSGSTSSIQYLERCGINTCKSVIILNDAKADDTEEVQALSDSRVLKTILAVMACTGENDLPPIVAELRLEAKQKLALNLSPKVSIIDEQSILAKLMVQTSRISGLAQVYDNLVGFEGCEFYFYRPAEGWGTITFKDLVFHFHNCSVLGLRKENGLIVLNPESAANVEANDEAILIAEDDSAIRFVKEAYKPASLQYKPASPQAKKKEKQLIVGWSTKAGIIIDEYSNYLTDGSAIDLVVRELTDDIQEEFKEIAENHPGIKLNTIESNIEELDQLESLHPEEYDNVIILTPDGGLAELRDSDTIAKLLEFRHYFRNLKTKDIKTQLITEVADSENIDVVLEAGVKDFLISNRFVSKIYAQVSEEPDVLKIYEDLFREEGCEVYLKPVSLYLSEIPGKINFGDLCQAALERHETCFGVRVMSLEKNREENYGIYINPDKNQIFNLKPEDLLITLAEDES